MADEVPDQETPEEESTREDAKARAFGGGTDEPTSDEPVAEVTDNKKSIFAFGPKKAAG